MRKSQNTFRDTLSLVSCPPISFSKTQLSSTLLSLTERASLVESSHISNFQKHSVIFDGLFFHFLIWIMELHLRGGLYLYGVFLPKIEQNSNLYIMCQTRKQRLLVCCYTATFGSGGCLDVGLKSLIPEVVSKIWLDLLRCFWSQWATLIIHLFW